MLKISISKIFSLLAVLLFFGRMAFSAESAAHRWEPYFPAAVQAKAIESLRRDVGQNRLDVRFSVAGVALAPAHSPEDLVERMGQLQTLIAAAKTEFVSIEIDGRRYVVDRVPLGEGLTGVAFQIRDSATVLKLPQPHAIAFKALMKESKTINEAGALEKAGLPIPKTYASHALGLYSVREKAPEMNLTEFLIQSKLIEVTSGGVRRISETQLELALRKGHLQSLAEKVEEALKARRQFENLNLDLGPDNLHLSVRGGEVEKMVLVDLGASSEKTKVLIDEIKTFSDYLTFSEKIIARYVQSGVFATRAAHVHHHEALCRQAFTSTSGS